MPDQNSTNKLQHQRLNDIYVLMLKQGSVEVAELARSFDVTTETIRRDLSALQAQGKARRVHGGAVPVDQSSHEPDVDTRDMQHAIEKLQIAKAAIAEVPDRGTVMIDSGSTLKRLAEVFPTSSKAHVITNSMTAGLQLARRGVHELTLLGGRVRTETYASVDMPTVDAVRQMRVDVLFISTDGLSFGRGLTTPYSDEATLKRAMIESARRVVALVDSSKMNIGQLYSYAELDALDVLITDENIDDETERLLREHSMELRIAGPQALERAS